LLHQRSPYLLKPASTHFPTVLQPHWQSNVPLTGQNACGSTGSMKAHVGADEYLARVDYGAVNSVNINDGHARTDALPDAPGEVFAVSAYRGPLTRGAVCATGGHPRIAATCIRFIPPQSPTTSSALWARSPSPRDGPSAALARLIKTSGMSGTLLRVKANGGAAEVDGQTIEDFEARLASNLYKLWNLEGSVRSRGTKGEGSRPH
jgi:hypothetical protein